MIDDTHNWSHPFGFAIISLVTITFLTILILVLSLASTGEPVSVYLINAFGFFVGLIGALLAFYTQFGPRFNLPLMPRGQVPPRVPGLLFILGTGVCLTSLRWLVDSDLMTLFFRVIGYAVFFAAFVGFAVSYVVRSAPVDGQGPLTTSMTDMVHGGGEGDCEDGAEDDDR